ncbi:MAG: hypothetical protein JRI70_04240 [Deltaproteobacteria bacterium]|nr:hypothetical protein [Deltaproteobacteria bacterium]MBW2170767.1 hypothetical protein [Deltaproteobacteria bacterium]MBW2258989.1 hypothetical protein [Deltaproteobacteria bacterium]
MSKRATDTANFVFQKQKEKKDIPHSALSDRSLEEAVANLEREMIVDALKTTRGNMAKASQMVQITERKFAYKAKQHGVDYREYR